MSSIGHTGRPAHALILCNSVDNGGGATLLFRVTQWLDKRRVVPTLLLNRDGWQAARQRATGYADFVVDGDMGAIDPLSGPEAADVLGLARVLARTTRGYGRVLAHIRQLAREREIDVLAGFGGTPAVLATLAGTLTGLPVIWSAQGGYDHYLRSVPHRAFAMMPSVRRIFAVSRAAAEPYQHVRRRVEITYNGLVPEDADPRKLVGTLRARHRIAPDVPLVGLAGRLVELKGVDLFLRAAAELATRHPKAKFVLIGRREGDAYDAELDRIVRTNGLADRVFFTGWVDDIRTEMLDLDVLAIPSRRDAAPLVCYEGMALERAIVASRVPGLDEQLVHDRTGLYFPREDVGALASAIDRLLADAALRARLGVAARADLCERFDLRHMVKRVEDTIVDLARERNGGRQLS